MKRSFPSRQTAIHLTVWRKSTIRRYSSINLPAKERITQRKRWQPFLQTKSLRGDLGPNQHKAHGDRAQTLWNSSDACEAQSNSRQRERQGSKRYNCLCFLEENVHQRYLPVNSHQKATSQEVTFKQMAREGTGETTGSSVHPKKRSPGILRERHRERGDNQVSVLVCL